MSKELIVAGSIVAACVGLTVVAFVQPAAKPAEVETASTDTVDSDPYASGSSPTSSYGTDPSSSSTSTFPGGSSTGFPGGSSSSSSTFPGNSSTSSTFPGGSSTSFPGSSTSFPGSSTSLPGSSTTSTPVVTAPVEPALPVVTTPVERTHTVAKGDTLGEISKQYYGTTRHWKKIKEVNNCDENGLAVGQKLIIPAIASEAPGSTASSSSAEGLYVVKSGDSYYRIAERELGNAGRAREIEKLNGIAADDLKPGQKLVLPPRSGSESTSSSSSSASTSSNADVPPGARVHVVAKDEYLIDISEKYYGTTSKWKRIADANPGVNPNRLMVGQKLVIPDAGGSSSTSSTSSSAPVASGDSYVVQKGDTLEKIAKNLLGDGSKWKDIAKLNPGVDPERLMVGQKLAVPAGAAKPAPAADPIPRPVTVPDRFPAPPPVDAFPAPGSSSTFPAPTTGADPAFPANDAFPAPTGGNPFPGASSTEGLPPPTTAPSPSASPWDDLPTLPPAGSEAQPAPAPPRDDPWNQFGTTR